MEPGFAALPRYSTKHQSYRRQGPSSPVPEHDIFEQWVGGQPTVFRDVHAVSARLSLQRSFGWIPAVRATTHLGIAAQGLNNPPPRRQLGFRVTTDSEAALKKDGGRLVSATPGTGWSLRLNSAALIPLRPGMRTMLRGLTQRSKGQY